MPNEFILTDETIEPEVKYARTVNGILNDPKIKEIIDRNPQIENEGRSRGLLDPSKLCANFNQEKSNEIVDMYKEWRELRNDRKDGKLDKAIENEDGKKIQQLMPIMAGINHRFLNLAAIRLQELS